MTCILHVISRYARENQYVEKANHDLKKENRVGYTDDVITKQKGPCMTCALTFVIISKPHLTMYFSSALVLSM